MFPMRIAGLALATSLSGIIAFFMLLVLLKRKIAPLPLAPLALFFMKVLCASLGMGLVCFLVNQRSFIPGAGVLLRLLNLAVVLLAGFISYVAFCFILRLREVQVLWKWVFRNKVG
jgi:putative peptidoglycan lipid II flippase